jgi:hypothetical protein
MRADWAGDGGDCLQRESGPAGLNAKEYSIKDMIFLLQ